MMDQSDAAILKDGTPVDKGFLAKILHSMAGAVATDASARIEKAVAPLLARIEALEKKPALKYCGVWEAAAQYNPGELCTHGGSLHHCNKSTRDRPGESSDWTLCVKRGAAGRDAR